MRNKRRMYAYQFLKTIAFFFIGLLLGGCNFSRETIQPTPVSTGMAYFPVKVGDSLLYRVKRILYIEDAGNARVKTDTSIFELLEVVRDTFRTLSGDFAYRIERFRRSLFSTEWSYDSLKISNVELGTLLELHPTFHQVMPQSVREWRIYPQRVVIIENNIPIVKLVFPPTVSASWNANVFNTLKPENYRLIQFAQPFLVDSIKYSPTITIIQSNQKSLINKDERWEVYAQEIGMVYRKHEVYNYVNTPFNRDFGQDKVVSGYFYEQKLLYRSK
ncbi:MAG: hypothetical protein NZM38_08340 [Cytophagales bacterium]|nr:hypothetical protein [Cytophagales bacterium]MDW8384766.1 hypothetical protein [Flammeovirgaceae bacterium]